MLLDKLHLISVQKKSHKFFEGLLMNRKQYTVYEGCKSTDDLVLRGVPQGSVRGPLLFLTYINYITNIGISEMISLNAEGTLLLYSGSPKGIFRNTQKDLDNITLWSSNNCIALNEKNSCYSCYMCFNTKHSSHNFCLQINNVNILHVYKIK